MHNTDMDLRSIVPLVLYDNECYLCIKFAKIVNFMARGRLLLVGHYTDLGEEIRTKFLDSSALEMFWFIDGKTAYGGRAALLPLLSAVISTKYSQASPTEIESFGMQCKTAKAVFLRSASLFSNSKKIPITT